MLALKCLLNFLILEYDWGRYFMKLAGDQHANFGAKTMYRFGGCVRF